MPADVIVDTSAAAAVRTPPGLKVFGAVYTLVYTFGVIAYIAISVYYDAFDYRSQRESSLLAAAWVLPFPIVAHLLHLVLYRSGRQRRQATARRTATRVVAEATAAGYPPLDALQVERMLLAEDNGPAPFTGTGKEPYRSLLRWDLPTDDPSFVVTAVRSGTPERIRLSAASSSTRGHGAAAAHRARAGLRLLGAYRSDLTAPLVSSRLGGLPAVHDGFDWPTCAEHDEPMQFTAQLEYDGSLILVFICQADPGSCPSWDPDAGSNAAIVVGGRDLHPAGRPASPSGTAVLTGEPWLLGVHQAGADDYSDALIEARADGVTVAGQWGGNPAWIQNDETPDGYRFVAMLDEDPLGSNFGGGSAYVFADGHGHAKVLTQT
ncbi:hypothetical protein [Curtobacterium flaccumfaciens]|uniref:hypothetical protein n=1 Tax=Curtobacterium flaccumfaciens TaxID=2035 RepID=UPI001BE0DE64|nr:hypothetical protein [Curtobacterium flaccumfaciens]MBT1582769.1 hypothetical protein [Curtobacterium flaccumfaciens pv. flaccumfaciens]MCX2797013.1 hypothetical protein [Curtobacterium flaccumfaciens pv. flaccumfaciens]